MLIKYNFRNFKSYKDEVSLDMMASAIKEHECNLIEGKKDEKFLKVASIHGANASGKSNIIESFGFMRRFVMHSFEKQNKENTELVKQFLLCGNNKERTSEFEVLFVSDDKEYKYGFELNNQSIYKEWLYKRDYRSRSRYKTLFERDGKKIEVGPQLQEAEKFKNYVEKRTLFLSFLSSMKISDAKSVLKWFVDTKAVNFGDALMENLMTRSIPYNDMIDEDYKKNFLGFLNAVDIGIVDVEVELVKNHENSDKKKLKFYSYHKAIDCDELIRFPFSEESSGTQKIACIYHLVMSALKFGNAIFIDELDAKLHPLMLQYIIKLFYNEKINKSGAQLIFTSHDASILNKELFRRDQIWLVEKDEYGVSSLVALVDYVMNDSRKVRKDASFMKDYLAGKYGAISRFEEFSI